MLELINLLIPIFTIIIVLLLFSVSVIRVPITSTKISFGVFCIFLLFWNSFQLFNNFNFFKKSTFELINIIFSCTTIYSIIVSALHFPFYRRREVLISIYTSFVGGICFLVIMIVFAIPVISNIYPLESRFYESITFLLVKAFIVFGLFSFLVIIIYKLTLSSDNFKKYSYRIVSYTSFTFLFLILMNYFLSIEVEVLKDIANIYFFDTVFLLSFLFALFQYKFINFYPGILSLILYGEIPRLVIEKVAPSNLTGAKYLKEELWKIYESENWRSFLNEFWFSIIIDETLDNAVEHGGRRWEDMVTVQIFETSKFLDIYVIDSGKGFEPSSIPNPLSPERKSIPTGRGIHIMKQLFQVSWNFLGNEIKVRVSKNAKENPQES